MQTQQGWIQKIDDCPKSRESGMVDNHACSLSNHGTVKSKPVHWTDLDFTVLNNVQ